MILPLPATQNGQAVRVVVAPDLDDVAMATSAVFAFVTADASFSVAFDCLLGATKFTEPQAPQLFERLELAICPHCTQHLNLMPLRVADFEGSRKSPERVPPGNDPDDGKQS